MSIKTIVFDIDGVLIWHHPSDPSKDWRRHLLPSDMLALWEEFQKSADWRRCLRDASLDTRRCFYRHLDRRGQLDRRAADRVIDTWLTYNLVPCRPALGKIKEWQASGFTCAIASNQDGLRKRRIERWLRKHALDTFPCFISCDVRTAKPDTDYFRHIEISLGRKPEELLLIDDTPENIAAARKAGWSSFLIDESYRLSPFKWNSIAFS